MHALTRALLLAAALMQVASAQAPAPAPAPAPGDTRSFPPQCRGPPPGVERPYECCKIPPFFPDEDFAECGFQRLDGAGAGGGAGGGGGPPPQPRGPPDCSKQLCMLSKHGLLAEDGQDISLEAVEVFLQQWGARHAAFAAPAAVAAARCLRPGLPGPQHVCQANRIVFCVSSTLFAECPVWAETRGCTALKEHLDVCKPFFFKQ